MSNPVHFGTLCVLCRSSQNIMGTYVNVRVTETCTETALQEAINNGNIDILENVFHKHVQINAKPTMLTLCTCSATGTSISIVKKYLSVITILLQFRTNCWEPIDMFLLAKDVLKAKKHDNNNVDSVLNFFDACTKQKYAGTLLSMVYYVAQTIHGIKFQDVYDMNMDNLFPDNTFKQQWVVHVKKCTVLGLNILKRRQTNQNMSLCHVSLQELGNLFKQLKKERKWFECLTILEILLFIMPNSHVTNKEVHKQPCCGGMYQWVNDFCIQCEPLEYPTQEPLYDNMYMWQVGGLLADCFWPLNSARTLLQSALLADTLYRPTASTKNDYVNKLDTTIRKETELYWHLLQYTANNPCRRVGYGNIRKCWHSHSISNPKKRSIHSTTTTTTTTKPSKKPKNGSTTTTTTTNAKNIRVIQDAQQQINRSLKAKQTVYDAEARNAQKMGRTKVYDMILDNLSTNSSDFTWETKDAECVGQFYMTRGGLHRCAYHINGKNTSLSEQSIYRILRRRGIKKSRRGRGVIPWIIDRGDASMAEIRQSFHSSWTNCYELSTR